MPVQSAQKTPTHQERWGKAEPGQPFVGFPNYHQKVTDPNGQRQMIRGLAKQPDNANPALSTGTGRGSKYVPGN